MKKGCTVSISASLMVGTREEILDSFFDNVHPQQGYARPESVELIEGAFEAVSSALYAVGTPEDRFSVHVSGHANEGRVHSDGWAEEFLSIQVGVQRPV